MPNDIFESGNVILSFGKTLIEIFRFEQAQNNNNNININNNQNNNNNKIEKKYEIPLNNNNPNNNNEINNDNNEILCVYLYQNNVICGHRSGVISIWTPTPGVYLKKKGEFKPSNSAINKILFEKFKDGKDYLLSCCADNTVKIISLESNQIVKESDNYGNEVMDIKMVNDIEGNNIFIISLKNGELKLLNMQLNLIMDIPSRFKTNKVRYVIGIKNPESNIDNNNGDLLIITEDQNLDIFAWIKPESIINMNNKNPHTNMPHGPHQMHFPHNRGGPHYYGNYH